MIELTLGHTRHGPRKCSSTWTRAENDSSPDWHQIRIFIFPRNSLTKLDDAAAEEKMNNALAGPKAIATGATQSTMLAGHRFRVSEFELKEPPFTRHAKIFTALQRSACVVCFRVEFRCSGEGDGRELENLGFFQQVSGLVSTLLALDYARNLYAIQPPPTTTSPS